jgi:hypothetical protein
MRPSASLRTLAVSAVLAVAGVANAAESSTQPPAVSQPVGDAANPILARPGTAKPNATEPVVPARRSRAISSDVASQLSTSFPKFTPPPPAPPKPDPVPAQPEEEVDARDIDKPRNGIIRLPKYIVREPPPPIFKEREVNTKKGLEAIAMKRYLTETDRVLNRLTLPLFGSSAEARAMAMYAEDERLKNMSDMREQTRMMMLTDPAAAKTIKQQADSTFNRPGSFDWRPMGR